MKTKLLLILCLLCLLSTATFAADPVGRYQLVPCEFATYRTLKGEAFVTTEKAVMKIDTATGRTWILVSLNIDFKETQSWVEIKVDDGSEQPVPPSLIKKGKELLKP